MKIYPSRHKILAEDRVKAKDVPLSCIVTDALKKEYHVDRVIEKAKTVSMETVLPYDEFGRPDPYLFDKGRNRIDVTSKMIRTDSGYAFFPPEAIEFSPALFDFRVLVKRNMTLENESRRDIVVGCIEKEDGTIADNLILLFGDPEKRLSSPPIITVNRGEVKKEAYANMSIEDCDFLFIDSPDGKNSRATGEEIDFDSIVDGHTNVVLVIDGYEAIHTAGGLDMQENGPFTTEAPDGVSYHDFSKIEVKEEDGFSNQLAPSYFSEKGYVLHKVFNGTVTPAVILEKPGKGYILIVKKQMLQQALANRAVITELLMQVYCRSYMKTSWFTGWITDAPVDYLPRQESIFGRNHEIYKIEKMLDPYLYRSGSQVDIVDVEIDNEEVKLKAVSGDRELFFEKQSTAKDPVKTQGQRSYYTTRHTVIHYEEESVNRLEMPLEIAFMQSSKGDYLHLKDYKSTSLHIDTMGDVRIRIPDEGASTYFLCAKRNVMSLIPAQTYTEDGDGIHLATIRAVYETVIKNYDTRIMGGGLPDDQPDDHNLLDIGHFLGRPHRPGGTMVIELPEELAQYDELIQDTVRRHIASGDHYIVVYE